MGKMIKQYVVMMDRACAISHSLLEMIGFTYCVFPLRKEYKSKRDIKGSSRTQRTYSTSKQIDPKAWVIGCERKMVNKVFTI